MAAIRPCVSLSRAGLTGWLAVRLHSGSASREQFLVTRPGLKARIIDGKKIAEAVKADITEEVREREREREGERD